MLSRGKDYYQKKSGISPKPKYFSCWIGENKVIITQKSGISPKPKDFGCWVGKNKVIVLEIIATWDLTVWLETYILLVKVILWKYDGENILVKMKFRSRIKWSVNFEGKLWFWIDCTCMSWASILPSIMSFNPWLHCRGENTLSTHTCTINPKSQLSPQN